MKAKASRAHEDCNKCLMHLLGESPGGLFLGVVRGVGNNVLTAPNCLVYNEYIVTRVL
jgi:hypothetical protein